MMRSTGIEALDAYLGGLVEGRFYVLSGPAGSGKTSAALQFLGAGLEAGERCAILTQDDPADLLAQAEYLGYDVRLPAEQERLVVLQYRLDFRRNYVRAADPGRVFEELRSLLGEPLPDRFVIDSVVPFVEGTRVGEEAMNAFFAFLDSLTGTTILTVPGDLGDGSYRLLYDRLTSGAAGVFHLEVREGQIRELQVRKLRQPARSTEPFRFVIRPGAGIVEHVPLRTREDLPEAFRRRVVVLHEGGALPEEVRLALEQAYEVVRYDAVEAAFADLATGRYGVLIIGLDPRRPDAAFHLTRQLRKAGNGAPIFYASSAQGLRSTTRARGLRAGGDDFLTDALSPEEFLAKIEAARARGHRRVIVGIDPEPVVRQPVDARGEPVPMSEEEFRFAVQMVLSRASHPFFAVVLVRPTGLAARAAWEVFRDRLRIREGDLAALLSDGRLALYLHDVRRRHVDDLLDRLVAAHPGLGPVELMDVYCYPADRLEIEEWLRGDFAPEPAHAGP